MELNERMMKRAEYRFPSLSRAGQKGHPLSPASRKRDERVSWQWTQRQMATSFQMLGRLELELGKFS